MESYELSDQGASIKIHMESNPTIDVYIVKSDIKSFGVYDDYRIKIELMTRPPIYLQHSQVLAPETASAYQLSDLLGEWLEQCSCSGEPPHAA